ncbi:hypothetical protein AKJ09_09821 [Labilithrix luteola]|uniref:Mobile element protein n=1 Tax=Labilithrix luteola TaxID=1391654 RepID=A0A0K1QBP9_9BACT|nr:hypothetical protein [Labilithrix luteola]AKV03158.1 hypothetical protein AKJ09_09821 [Labilithrix luteola]
MKRYRIELTEAQARCLLRHAWLRVTLNTAPNEQHREWRGIKAACERAGAPSEPTPKRSAER